MTPDPFETNLKKLAQEMGKGARVISEIRATIAAGVLAELAAMEFGYYFKKAADAFDETNRIRVEQGEEPLVCPAVQFHPTMVADTAVTYTDVLMMRLGMINQMPPNPFQQPPAVKLAE